jgi:TorA maturation chaperone TorD
MEDVAAEPSESSWAKPPVELIRALAVLAEPPGPEHAAVAEALGLGPVPEHAHYAQLFLFQLYPYASVYLGPDGMLGGEPRGRIAGFWSAVGRTPPAEPDHLSALLGLYAGLLVEASDAGDSAEGELVRQGISALLSEHVAPWCFAFLERVQDLDRGFYGRWAALLEHTLLEGIGEAGPTTSLPVHLRDATPLPDPRSEGGRVFLSALVAPARTGMVLTRSDLRDIAVGLKLGLRVGERRYILENLLSQQPGPVLDALSERAARAAERHTRRRERLGVIADFWSNRASAAAALLGDLAGDGSWATDPSGRSPEVHHQPSS